MPFWPILKGLRPAAVLFEGSLDSFEDVLTDQGFMQARKELIPVPDFACIEVIMKNTPD